MHFVNVHLVGLEGPAVHPGHTEVTGQARGLFLWSGHSTNLANALLNTSIKQLEAPDNKW